ncbi:YIP1 family protein [Mammaliicoccus vitulinus]|uniref:YIP1 family protein n=1 Tax=Mammaliicoccus vitulinus TaxID=71237 RepID=UPI003BA02989
MKNSNLVFAPTFNKFRENPKWLVNMILVIIVAIASTWIATLTTDVSAELKEAGLSEADVANMSTFTSVFTYIGAVIGAIIGVAFMFLLILIVSKIMKSDVKATSLFAATTFMTLITSIYGLIIVAIHAIIDLDPVKYSFTSLKIFNQSNQYLGIFDLNILLGAYLFGVVLYATSHLKGKTALIWSIVYLVLVIGIGLIQASVLS